MYTCTFFYFKVHYTLLVGSVSVQSIYNYHIRLRSVC